MVKKTYIRYVAFLFSVTSFLLFILYSGWILYRTNEAYEFLKTSPKAWSGNVHKEDPELGYASIPDSEGTISLMGESIPVRYDRNGFRVTANKVSTDKYKRPLYLFLGGSFTFGDSCRAENAYPYLVVEQLGGEAINAGYCSYGLAQMLLLAGDLIPKHKPDYVIVQYSPWLVHRAASAFAPTYVGELPTPYFYETSGALGIANPPYLTKIFSLPIADYRKMERGIRDFLSFMVNVSIPLFTYDDYNKALSSVKMRFGYLPDPSRNKIGIKHYAYREISRVCKENNCEMIVVTMGNYLKDKVIYEKFDIGDHVSVVSADKYLKNHILRQEKVFSLDLLERYYAHWRSNGIEYVSVDSHPNPLAHGIIANAIIEKIQGLRDTTH
jgi:hypothetical protein